MLQPKTHTHMKAHVSLDICLTDVFKMQQIKNVCVWGGGLSKYIFCTALAWCTEVRMLPVSADLMTFQFKSAVDLEFVFIH